MAMRRSRRVAWIAGMALLAAGARGAETPDVAQILQRTSARYKAIRDYRIEVRHSGTGRLVGAMGADVDIPPLWNLMQLSRAGTTLRLEGGLASSKQRWVEVRQGERQWIYSPEQHEYLERAMEPAEAATGPGPGALGKEWTHVARFRVIDGMAAKTKLLKAGVAADAECPHESVLLAMELAEGGAAREQIRIDLETGLVCRMEVRTVDRVRHSTWERTRVMIYRYPQVEGPVNEADLAFVPPKKARKVQKFSPAP